MKRKNVYVNDRLIGEASSWPEVRELLKAQGIRFLAKPGVAEGPSAFYVSGASAEASPAGIGKNRDLA